ncbi:MAG: roadblock/LC7 domain-containing protein [Candidatus Ranarchaeia archaeon]
MNASISREQRIQQIVEKVKGQPGVEHVLLVDKQGFPIRGTFPADQSELAAALLVSVFGQLDRFGETLGIKDLKSINMRFGDKHIIVVCYGNLYMIAVRSS